MRSLFSDLGHYIASGLLYWWAMSVEKGRIEKEQKDAKDQNTPNLQGDILFFSAGEGPTDPNTTVVILMVSVTNLGAPSITKNWR